jgi:hypothetical protein
LVCRARLWGCISKDEDEDREGRKREEEREEGKYGMVRITRAGRGGTEKEEAKGGDGGSNAREIDIVLEGEGRGIRYDICIDKRRVVRRVQQG